MPAALILALLIITFGSSNAREPDIDFYPSGPSAHPSWPSVERGDDFETESPVCDSSLIAR